MDPLKRAERVVALKAIAGKAEDLADKGSDPLEVQTFVAGARRKLAEERPDYEAYLAAAKTAKKAQLNM